MVYFFNISFAFLSGATQLYDFVCFVSGAWAGVRKANHKVDRCVPSQLKYARALRRERSKQIIKLKSLLLLGHYHANRQRHSSGSRAMDSAAQGGSVNESSAHSKNPGAEQTYVQHELLGTPPQRNLTKPPDHRPRRFQPKDALSNYHYGSLARRPSPSP